MHTYIDMYTEGESRPYLRQAGVFEAKVPLESLPSWARPTSG